MLVNTLRKKSLRYQVVWKSSWDRNTSLQDQVLEEARSTTCRQTNASTLRMRFLVSTDGQVEFRMCKSTL